MDFFVKIGMKIHVEDLFVKVTHMIHKILVEVRHLYILVMDAMFLEIKWTCSVEATTRDIVNLGRLLGTGRV